MKKLLCIVIVLLSMLNFCACSNQGSSSSTNSVSSPQEAVNVITSDSWFDKEIALRCGFNRYYDAVIGSNSAELNSTKDAYIVTIKGHMLGYADEYATDLVEYNFTLVKMVSCIDGSVSNISTDIDKGD